LYITKTELTKVIKQEITNYLLTEGAWGDFAAKASSAIEKYTPDFLKPEEEEEVAQRDYEGRLKDAKLQKKMYGGGEEGRAATKDVTGVDPDASEEDLERAHRKKIGKVGRGRADATQAKNMYYDFLLAQMGAWMAKKIGVAVLPTWVTKLIAKKVAGFAARFAASIPLSATLGPVGVGALLVGRGVDLALIKTDIWDEFLLYRRGKRSMSAKHQIAFVRDRTIQLRRDIKEKGAKWRYSEKGTREKIASMKELKSYGMLEVVKAHKRGETDKFSAMTGGVVDYNLPMQIMKYIRLINTLGPEGRKRDPSGREFQWKPKPPGEPARPRVSQASSEKTKKPKQRKKISKRSYKRKFWSILKKAGERFGKNGTWKGLNTSHPARVAYRKYARVGKPVPGGIKSELKSMGLLT